MKSFLGWILQITQLKNFYECLDKWVNIWVFGFPKHFSTLLEKHGCWKLRPKKRSWNTRRVRKQRRQYLAYVLVGPNKDRIRKIVWNAAVIDGKNVNLRGCSRNHKRVFRRKGSLKEITSICQDKLLKINLPFTFFSHPSEGGFFGFAHGLPGIVGRQGGTPRHGYKTFRKSVKGDKQCSWKDRIEAVRAAKPWLDARGVTHLLADVGDPIRAEEAVKPLKDLGYEMLPSCKTHVGGYPTHTPYFSTLDSGIFPHYSKWVSEKCFEELKKKTRETEEHILWRVAMNVIRRKSCQDKMQACYANYGSVLKAIWDANGAARGKVM